MIVVNTRATKVSGTELFDTTTSTDGGEAHYVFRFCFGDQPQQHLWERKKNMRNSASQLDRTQIIPQLKNQTTYG